MWLYVFGFGLIMGYPAFPEGSWIPVVGMGILLYGFIYHTIEQGPGRGNRDDI